MIETAEEFVYLRQGNISEEQHRATHDTATISVWLDVIHYYPEFKIWVVHNKTIQIEILELLAKDPDAHVRGAVARKRKAEINACVYPTTPLFCNLNISYLKGKNRHP